MISRPHSRGSGRWRTSTRRARLPHDLGAAPRGEPGPGRPVTLDEHQPPAGTQRRHPAAHRQRRVGQRPQHVPAEHDVDGCRCQPGVGGVPVAHRHQVAHPARRVRELRAGEAHHGGREVERVDGIPLLGEQHREGARAAAEVDDVGRRRRQHPEQQVTPGGAHVGVEQPVVGRLVERGRLGVPECDGVDAHSSSSWARTSSEMSPLAKTSCTSSESSSASMTRIIFFAPSRSSGTCRVGTHDASAES